MLKRMGIVAVVALAIIFYATGSAAQPPETAKRTEIYTVRAGDTLWQIAERYAAKNTYGRQYLPEYLEGIRQNPANWELFENRSRPLQVGDRLEMVYWVKEAGE